MSDAKEQRKRQPRAPRTREQLEQAPYLLAGELATMLVVSEKTIARWATAKDSTMPCLRIGGTLRFPKERVLQWLRASEQGRGKARQQSIKQVLSVVQPSEEIDHAS